MRPSWRSKARRRHGLTRLGLNGFHIRKQFGWLTIEGPRDTADVQERHIPTALLDIADVGAMEPRHLTKGLLRETTHHAPLAYRPAESVSGIHSAQTLGACRLCVYIL